MPAGAALAVDRERFAAAVEAAIAAEPLITVVRDEVDRCRRRRRSPLDPGDRSPDQRRAAGEPASRLTGRGGLHFFDAIAPTVTLESLDLDVLYRASRYDKGEADYLNAAMDEPTYLRPSTQTSSRPSGSR